MEEFNIKDDIMQMILSIVEARHPDNVFCKIRANLELRKLKKNIIKKSDKCISYILYNMKLRTDNIFDMIYYMMFPIQMFSSHINAKKYEGICVFMVSMEDGSICFNIEADAISFKLLISGQDTANKSISCAITDHNSLIVNKFEINNTPTTISYSARTREDIAKMITTIQTILKNI